jgi:DNA polymerase zeta
MDSSQEDPEAIDAFIRVKLNDIMVTMTHPLQQMNRVYQPPNPNAATSFPLGTLPAKVPVIRIFGITPKHQSVCLNVHGIWPYFFVEYPQGRSLDPDSVYRYTHRFANALNSALCQSLRQDPYGAPNKPGQGTFNTSTLHVASIVLCKGVPFYGYHVGYSYFLKIALVTPSHKYRAVNLLEGGSIMQKKFAVYESHLDTKLQFMVDFDLYGCGWVEVQEALFRRPLPGEWSLR